MRSSPFLSLVVLAGCIATQPIDDPDPRDAGNASDGLTGADAVTDAGARAAAIDVTPARLDFPAGAETSLPVRVASVGDLPLHLLAVTVEGDAAFRLVDPPGDDPDGDGEPGIAPGSGIELRVRARSAAAGATATLVVESDDPARPRVQVSLTAQGDAPCLEARPGRIEFPPTAVGGRRLRQVAVAACDGQPVELQRVSLSADSSPAFAIAGVPQAEAVELSFAPSEVGEVVGALVLETAGRPALVVPVIGAGIENACPEPAVVRDQHEVALGAEVELDGSPSVDPDGPDGRPAAYEWLVQSRPEGSTAQPVEGGDRVDDPSTPTAAFTPDVVGHYELALRVRDGFGAEAPSGQCPGPPVVVVIEARAGEGLFVELTWVTPGDPDPRDRVGVDLDLHFRHPRADGWGLAPYDCFYANPSPDWGAAGPLNNPDLLRDDIDGAGPESLLLATPEVSGEAYRVGVVAYRAEDPTTGMDLGPSMATVKLWLDGVPLGAWSRELLGGDTWEVVDAAFGPDGPRLGERDVVIPEP